MAALLAIQGNRANEFALLEHWDGCKCSRASDFDEGNDAVVFSDVVRSVLRPGMWTTCLVLRGVLSAFRIVAHIEHWIAPQIDVAFLTVDRYGAKDISLPQKQIPELASQMRLHSSTWY